MPFHCVVITPEQQTFDATVTQAILPAFDGLIGILAGRSPLLVKLGVGPLRLDLANGQSRTYFIDSGIAQMKDNDLTILTTQAIEPKDIDVEAARAEAERATAMRITDEKSLEARNRALARGRVQQAMAVK
jgi:F-type H+-transporting ATPase subunit epsilon